MKQEMYDIMLSVNDHEFFHLSILYHVFLTLAYIFVYITQMIIDYFDDDDNKLKTHNRLYQSTGNNIYGAYLKLGGTYDLAVTVSAIHIVHSIFKTFILVM